MKRKLYNDLLEWKTSPARKPLILLGARQVGKTWLMKEFGQNEFKNVAYVNCDREPLMRDLFKQDYDIGRILLGVQAVTGQSITAGETLIIFDEIQEAPRGLTSLKYFCEDAPEYHVMAAGSMLGVTLAHGESFPVGKVDVLHLYPMDYNEYLDALGQERLREILDSGDYTLAASLRDRYVEALRQYYFTGGMPEAVETYVTRRDLNAVRGVQQKILLAYRNDISKHASKHESVRIGQVFGSLPSQLAKENKKFIYGALRSGARAADYEMAIQWLQDAGLIYKVNRVDKIALPLKFYEDFGAFKLFLLDVGLLGCMADVPAAKIIVGSEAFSEYKGAMTEQYVAQQMVACGVHPYYWSNPRTPAEIDFVMQHNDTVVPVEVKAETNVRAKSLNQVLKDNPSLHGLRISMRDYIRQDTMTNIPLYALCAYLGQSSIRDM